MALSDDLRSIRKDDAAAKIIRRIFDLRLSGMTTTEVAAKLNIEGVKTARGKQWSTQNISRVISSPRYHAREMTHTVLSNPLDSTTSEAFTVTAPVLITADEWTRANTRQDAGRKATEEGTFQSYDYAVREPGGNVATATAP
jgi:hypothetical protein